VLGRPWEQCVLEAGLTGAPPPRHMGLESLNVAGFNGTAGDSRAPTPRAVPYIAN
jgi:hypothetical protein